MSTKFWRFALFTPLLAVFGCSSGDSETPPPPKAPTVNATSENVENRPTTGDTRGLSDNEHRLIASSKQETIRVSSLETDPPAAPADVDPPQAQLFEKMGTHTRTITTKVPETQEYFNQGLTWMHAFNHDEAIRSFRRAAELDKDCAMAWWGVSIAAGPQYNHAIMTEARIKTARESMDQAFQRIENTTPVERALIEALEHRNADSENAEDWTAQTEAYAQAMEKVWEAYPDDSDVGALYAEAMMVRRPWKLYTLDHVAHEDTPKILATLERVLELDPDHPGALHLYIHAIEPSGNPGRGLVAAERLSQLVPASGHLLHMPSHIYVKTGFWEKAIAQNVLAMQSDKAYRILSPQQLVQHVYMTHNAHMRAYASMMVGREKEAMAAARNMWENVDEGTLRQLGPVIDRWMCSVYDVQKRFGRWDAIIAEEAPPSSMLLTTATWRAARTVAFAAKKDFEKAQREYDAFLMAKNAIPQDTPWARDDAHRVLQVGNYFIAGEIALQKGNWDVAIVLLKEAAAVEDTLGYGEPPQWLQPVRHTLGAVYLKVGNNSEAERVYREDLAKWPNNGWSLNGLSEALENQGKAEEAAKVKEQYLKIWSNADEPTATSCKCISRN